jgi:putative hemolysin
MTAIILIFRLILPMIVTQNVTGDGRCCMMRHPLRLLFSLLGVIANPIFTTSFAGWQREEEAAAESDAKRPAIPRTTSELQAFLDVGEEEGIIEEEEGEMIQSIIRFSDRTVVEVMTPRTRVVAVDAGRRSTRSAT